jgi:hypothetical protein
LVLWFFGADFAASLTVFLLVLPPFFVAAIVVAVVADVAAPTFGVAVFLLLLLLPRDFRRPCRGEWVEAGEARVWGTTAMPSLHV